MPFMHDRELGFPRNSFWVLVLVAGPTDPVDVGAVHLVVAVVLGVLWQVAYRRDLAHRLSALCVFWVFGVALMAAFSLVDVGHVSWGEPLLAYLASVVSGLVLCELGLRVRDDRRARAAHAAAREGVPARP